MWQQQKTGQGCADSEPIEEEDLTRMALIDGMKDRSLAGKALAENYELKIMIDPMKTRECSKVNVVGMRVENYET